MWQLKFPFFAFKLLGNYLRTIIHLVIFQLNLKTNKLLIANTLLTFTLLILVGFLLWLPPVQSEPAPKLAIDLNLSKETTPLYSTIKIEEKTAVFDEYREKVINKTIISQAEYINLAILAHTAGYYETANKYLQLALYINPNRDFFVY